MIDALDFVVFPDYGFYFLVAILNVIFSLFLIRFCRFLGQKLSNIIFFDSPTVSKIFFISYSSSTHSFQVSLSFGFVNDYSYYTFKILSKSSTLIRKIISSMASSMCLPIPLLIIASCSTFINIVKGRNSTS